MRTTNSAGVGRRIIVQEVWGRNPPEAEAVCRHCLQIMTVATIKNLNFHTIHLLILDQYVAPGGGGLRDILGGGAQPQLDRDWCSQ